jgi:hypothetical protein
LMREIWRACGLAGLVRPRRHAPSLKRLAPCAPAVECARATPCRTSSSGLQEARERPSSASRHDRPARLPGHYWRPVWKASPSRRAICHPTLKMSVLGHSRGLARLGRVSQRRTDGRYIAYPTV